MNTRGGATLGVAIALGVIMATDIVASRIAFNWKNDQLIRQLDSVEGFYSSEMAAWAIYQKNRGRMSSESQNAPLDKNSLKNNVRRYQPGSVVASMEGDEFCGISVFHVGGRMQRRCIKGPGLSNLYTVTFPNGYLKETPSTTPYPLDLYFVVDVSGSMGSNISAIVDSVSSFSTDLSSTLSAVRFGAVSFLDGVSSTQHLTDAVTFKSYLSSQIATGGGDLNEGGLLALQTAVNNIDADDPTNSSLKAIFYFTDNPAHNGGPDYIPYGSSRDCTLEKTSNQLKGRSDEKYGPLHFFHSVSAYNWSVWGGCSGFVSAADQMQALLNLVVFPNTNNMLPYPVTTAALDELKRDLIRLPPPNADVCLPKKASFYFGEKLINTWNASSMEDVYNVYETKTPASYSIATETDFTGQEAYKMVTYECFARADATARNFSHGYEEQPVKEPITFIK